MQSGECVGRDEWHTDFLSGKALRIALDNVWSGSGRDGKRKDRETRALVESSGPSSICTMAWFGAWRKKVLPCRVELSTLESQWPTISKLSKTVVAQSETKSVACRRRGTADQWSVCHHPCRSLLFVRCPWAGIGWLQTSSKQRRSQQTCLVMASVCVVSKRAREQALLGSLRH